MRRLGWAAGLHHENALLREALAREFAELSSMRRRYPRFARDMDDFHGELLTAVDANEAALTELTAEAAPASAWGRVRARAQWEWDDLMGTHAEPYGRLGSLLRHLAKDWTAAGADGCAKLHGRVLLALREALRPSASILVPGCGMARLAARIATEMPSASVRAVELSPAQLAIGEAMLRAEVAGAVTFHPFVDEPRNNFESRSRTIALRAPDVAHAGVPPNLTLACGDFADVADVDHPRHDAVVTHFFIDCPADVVTTIERVHACLAPGGLWVHAGPLAWHHWPALSPCLSQLLNLGDEIGLEPIGEPEVISADYLARPKVMSHENRWDAAFIACCKRA